MTQLEDRFRMQIAGVEGSFVGYSVKTNQFDCDIFCELTAVMFEIAYLKSRNNTAPQWILDGYHKLKTDVPDILLRLEGADRSYLEEQATLIEDLWYYFSEGVPPYDLETLQLLSTGG